MIAPELLVELLRAEYPFLQPDHDPDVERYFDLRSLGRSADALAVYRSRLRPRYPDDEFRARMLRAYRLKDPSYPLFLSIAYEKLGARVLDITKRTIRYICARVESYDPTDAYSTIKAAESIIAILPRDRFEAIAAMERLSRYAVQLSYGAAPMAQAETLVRSYLNEALTVVADELERRKGKRPAHSGAGYAGYAGPEGEEEAPSATPVLDLSSVRFSAADIERITIPARLAKLEDRTLAYCYKYWMSAEDPAFERVLFLYSHKYKSPHYDIFKIIRRDRRAGKRDDEILAAVMAVLITGYYYSIRGDMYLQRRWAALKAGMEGLKTGSGPLRRSRPGPASPSALPAVPVPSGAAGPHSSPRRRVAVLRSIPSIRRPAPNPKARISPPPPGIPRPAAASAAAAAGDVAIYGAGAVPGAAAAKAAALPSGSGSVSDYLCKLSGRSYDVYHDRFLSKARVAIRKVLRGDRGLFFPVPQEAEDLVFGFLKAHYSDPFMDWAASEERKTLGALGFEVSTMDGVIEECYTNLHHAHSAPEAPGKG